MNGNPYHIKLVAVDMDGTFLRSNKTFDRQKFRVIYQRMRAAGCQLVVASGNQYAHLRTTFRGYEHDISFVAENGALVVDKDDLVFTAEIPKKSINQTIELCRRYPEIDTIMCGLHSAYCEHGTVSQSFYQLASQYYDRLQWVDDLKSVDDKILKFAPTVPIRKTKFYFDLFQEKLKGQLVPTGSGRGSVDLIKPGCHKATGLKQLVQRWGISAADCAAFGDGGNDLEMLAYCGRSYAMENAPEQVKEVAKSVCPTNDADGVLTTLDKLFPRS